MNTNSIESPNDECRKAFDVWVRKCKDADADFMEDFCSFSGWIAWQARATPAPNAELVANISRLLDDLMDHGNNKPDTLVYTKARAIRSCIAQLGALKEGDKANPAHHREITNEGDFDV